MPELSLKTSRKDRMEFNELLKKFNKSSGNVINFHTEELEEWLDIFAQKCFKVGKDAAKIQERND